MNHPELENTTTTIRRRTWLCVVPAMVLPLTASLLYFVWLGDHPAARLLYGFTKIFTLAWPIFALWWIERSSRETSDAISHTSLVTQIQSALREAAPHTRLRALPLGLLTGGAIALTTLLLFHFGPVGDYARTHGEGIVSKVRDFGLDTRLNYIAFAVFIAVLHSGIEEYYWRWFLFGRLRQLTPMPIAILLAATAFAAHHFVILSRFFPAGGTVLFGCGVAVGGALWCWMMQRQSTVLGSWLSHALVDAAILYVGYCIVF